MRGHIDAAGSPAGSPARLALLMLSVLVVLLAGAISARADSKNGLPALRTNQGYVERATARTTLDIADPLAVFGYVLSSLPARVTVYPTENYYYFSFTHNGLDYAGNIRLENGARDKGVVHFAYFRADTAWQRHEALTHKTLSKVDGVQVTRLGKLSYRLAFRGKDVRFDLIDLSAVTPPKSKLGADERYIGPVFDESGIQFYLLFNEKLSVFHYILNEEVPVGERLIVSKTASRIHIGQRTAFAYYRDHHLDRKILIGVYEANAAVNNYLDGPFDQLPDNFIKGEALRTAILKVDPSLKGKIDRFGSAFDGTTRFVIGPYMHYRDEADLAIFDRCANDPKMTRARYYGCFAVEPAPEDVTPRPRKAPGKPPEPRRTTP